ALRALFEAPESAVLRREVRGETFARSSWEASGEARLVLDRFRDAGDASCCFVRLAPAEGSTRLVVEGAYGLEACASGGWLLWPAREEYSLQLARLGPETATGQKD